MSVSNLTTLRRFVSSAGDVIGAIPSILFTPLIVELALPAYQFVLSFVGLHEAAQVIGQAKAWYYGHMPSMRSIWVGNGMFGHVNSELLLWWVDFGSAFAVLRAFESAMENWPVRVPYKELGRKGRSVRIVTWPLASLWVVPLLPVFLLIVAVWVSVLAIRALLSSPAQLPFGPRRT